LEVEIWIRLQNVNFDQLCHVTTEDLSVIAVLLILLAVMCLYRDPVTLDTSVVSLLGAGICELARRESNAHYIRSLMVDEERMRLGHGLQSVPCVPFSVSRLIQGRPKKRLFLRVNNFATANGSKACNMSKDSEFCLE